MSKEVVIVDGARTPIGRFGGALKDLTAADIGVVATRAALAKAGVAPEQVEEVIFGHARQAGCGPNVARQISVRAGIPASAPAFGVQQACVSGMQALVLGYQRIMLGDADIVMTGGVEHMSSVPFLSVDTRWGSRLGDARLLDAMYKDGYICALAQKHMGELTDDLAKELGISRREQDEYALGSQQGAVAGKTSGFFAKFLAPVEVRQRGQAVLFQDDEHVRPDTTLEKLAALPPAFHEDGTITAGNASGITDGATAMVLASKAKAGELGLRPLGYIRSYAFAATEPERFGLSPVYSSRLALQRLGMRVDEMDLVEINEAFAAQVIAVMRGLEIPRSKVNIYGGAISLGHPTGNSGARIVLNLLYALRERGLRWGLAGICGNGGNGGSVTVEAAL
ncbi:MAG: thiolase family protein [Chloroflexi bacterium]|nr:thiolase family protein [Chloroflexota bacterium]